MGLGFKKKKDQEKTPRAYIAGADTAAATNDYGGGLNVIRPIVSATSSSFDVSEDSLNSKKPKLRWSPLRKKHSSKNKQQSPQKAAAKTNNNNEQLQPAVNILASLNVATVTDDCVEILTEETQRALIAKRETIRRKLFQDDNELDGTDDDDDKGKKTEEIEEDTIHRVSTDRASNRSVEKLDKIWSAPTLSDRYSMPMEDVVSTSIWETDSSKKISEQPVKHGFRSKGSAPVSVDVSYTESELVSVATASIRTPPRASSTPLLPPSGGMWSLGSSIRASVDLSFNEKDQDTSILNSPVSEISPNVVSPISPAESTISNESKNRTKLTTPPNKFIAGIDIDERQTGNVEKEEQINGKSPVKGMPDEDYEHRRDYTSPLPIIDKVEDSKNQENVRDAEEQMQQLQKVEMNSSTVASQQTSIRSSVTVCDETAQGTISTKPTSVGSTTSRTTFDTSTPKTLIDDVLEAVQQCTSSALSTKTRKEKVREPIQNKEQEDRKKRSLLLDEVSTHRFLRRITLTGFVLLHIQAPGAFGNTTNDWNGRTVTMLISKGALDDSSVEKHERQPKLEWSTVAGGRAIDITTTKVNLLSIVAIDTEGMETDCVEQEDVYFTITTEVGDIYIFESATTEERDLIVVGLRTIISRFCFHLVAGDISGASELLSSYSRGQYHEEGDLPSLPNPAQGMNYSAHALMDS